MAPHRPDVVVADRRRVVDEDLAADGNGRRGKDDEPIARFSNSRIGITGVVEISPGCVTGIEIRLRAESYAIGREAPAAG